MTKSKQHKKKSLRTNHIEKLAQEIGIDAAQLEAEFNQLPTINASRIVNLHGRLTAGSYEIKLKETSKKLLSFEQKLNLV